MTMSLMRRNGNSGPIKGFNFSRQSTVSDYRLGIHFVPRINGLRMANRILVAPDKFKGTLSAREAAGAMVNGWWAARPQDEMEMLPITDGGEGFGELLAGMMDAAERTVATVDAAHRPLEARWWWREDAGVAIIESAQIIGLAMLPPGRFHPFELDTRGLGTVIRAAVDAGAQTILVGVGGSATNDAGFGMASELGWQFLDDQNRPLEKWPMLTKLAGLVPPQVALTGVDFIVAVDVDNPLLGMNGCTRVYGPQKGLMVQMAPAAEAALEKLAQRVRTEFERDFANEPGSGAAGGLGFGFRAFLGASMESGFDIFARQSKLDEHIEAADLILTGEGMIDRQSMMGKGTGRLARRCKALGKRCIGFGGMVEGVAKSHTADRLFHSVHEIAPNLATPAEARKNAAFWLERLVKKVAEESDFS